MIWKWRKWLLIIVGSGVAVGFAAYFAPKREPSYQGKYLSQWVTQGGRNYAWLDSGRKDAVRHMGTNVLPFLIKWLDAKPTTNGSVLVVKSFITNLPPAITPASWAAWARRDYKWDRALVSAYAIGDLGEQAQVALPELIEMMNADNRKGSSDLAILALAGIGKPAIPVLIETLADTNHPQRRMIINMFGWPPAMYTNAPAATSAVPLLVKCMTGNERGLKLYAARALARMAEYDCSRADLVVPEFVKLLSATNAGAFRTVAIRGLGAYGNHDETIAPLLLPLLNDPDRIIRWNATNAIRQIAPFALPNSTSLQNGEEAP